MGNEDRDGQLLLQVPPGLHHNPAIPHLPQGGDISQCHRITPEPNFMLQEISGKETWGLKGKWERSPLLLCCTALEPGALLDQGIDPVQPKEQTKAQRRAISRMLQKSPGLPQLASRGNARKGQGGTVSLKKWRDYRRGVFSLETGRLTGPQTGISLLVKTKSRSNWLFSVKTTPRAQSLPPHTLLSSKLWLLNPTGDRLFSQA